MLQWVYESTKQTGLFSSVHIATDSAEIDYAAKMFSAPTILTSMNHKCGTDRAAEAAQVLRLSDNEIVVNIQADQPIIPSNSIKILLSAFNVPKIQYVTLANRIDKHAVKVFVTPWNMKAIRFCRANSSYQPDLEFLKEFSHIGIYAYRNRYLQKFSRTPQTINEKKYHLEQLRAVENDDPLYVKLTDDIIPEINVKEDISYVENTLQQMKGAL